jgi:uncharacterized protein (TIGR00725 family)
VAPVHVAVAGSADAPAVDLEAAEAVGRALAKRGAVVVCGGRDGAMEAACRGAKSAGGATVGILPGSDRAEANPFVDVAIPTGLGEARNVLVVRAADALIAVGGEWGTLSEIALALGAGMPVAGLESWELSRRGGKPEGVVAAESPEAAVAFVLDAVQRGTPQASEPGGPARGPA